MLSGECQASFRMMWEAGCRTVIGKRLKQSGMFWSQSVAENILALRCALLGNRWDECWNQINQSGQFQTRAAP